MGKTMIARMLRATFAALALCCVITAGAETLTNPLIIGGQLQGSQATVSFKIPSGTANPATCRAGQLFFNTTTPALEYCSATNTWTAVGSGSGTVTSVSVTTANGVSGSVANPTTTPAISLTLGAITPSSVTATGTVGFESSGGNAFTFSGTPTATRSIVWADAAGTPLLDTTTPTITALNRWAPLYVSVATGNGTITSPAAFSGLGLWSTSGAPSPYGGTSCTNQFPRSLNDSGAATCAPVSLIADVTGTLPAANGGTGVTDLTFSGNTHKAATASGTLTSGNCVQFDASGNVVDSGGPCGGGTGAFTNLSASAIFKLTGTEDVTTGSTQTQAGATTLSSSVFRHNVTVNASNQNGVKFASSPAIGEVHLLVNETTNLIQVYGSGSDTVNGITATTGATMGNASSGPFSALFMYTATGWQTLGPIKYTTSGNLLTASVNGNGVTFQSPNVNPARLTVSATNPTLTSGGCTGAALTGRNGTALFSINVGTSCTGSQPLVIGMPTANFDWNCFARDSTNAGTAYPRQSSAASTTSITLTNYAAATGLAGAWTDSDVIIVSCVGG